MDTVAVTGATGQLGGRVARGLVAAGVPVRLIARDPSRLPDITGATVAPAAEYYDSTAMSHAVEGADTLFLVSARESADRVAEHVTAVDAAVAAGVTRVVYISFLGAAPDATFTFARDHWHTEQHLHSTGVRFTVLRDSFYLASLPAMTGADGVLRGPGGDGLVSAVAHDDIAETAVAVLSQSGHDSRIYDVTGPEALSLREVAEILSGFSGRDISYVAESEDEAYESRSAYQAPDWEIAGWVTSYQAIANGELATVSDTVPRFTGHPAQSFSDYLSAHPESYRHLIA